MGHRVEQQVGKGTPGPWDPAWPLSEPTQGVSPDLYAPRPSGFRDLADK